MVRSRSMVELTRGKAPKESEFGLVVVCVGGGEGAPCGKIGLFSFEPPRSSLWRKPKSWLDVMASNAGRAGWTMSVTTLRGPQGEEVWATCPLCPECSAKVVGGTIKELQAEMEKP